MKKKILVIFLFILLNPIFLFAADSVVSDGFHYYNSVGIVSAGTGIGYRLGRFETGGSLSSSALNTSVAMLLTNGRPFTGFLLGLFAFGGIDAYARYDLVPHPKYELSLGVGAGATYCLVGTLDIGLTASLSIRSAINIGECIMLFFETGVPLYYWEYADSCSPILEESSYESNARISHGFTYSSSFAAMAGLLMTTRIGAEVLF